MWPVFLRVNECVPHLGQIFLTAVDVVQMMKELWRRMSAAHTIKGKTIHIYMSFLDTHLCNVHRLQLSRGEPYDGLGSSRRHRISPLHTQGVWASGERWVVGNTPTCSLEDLQSTSLLGDGGGGSVARVL